MEEWGGEVRGVGREGDGREVGVRGMGGEGGGEGGGRRKVVQNMKEQQAECLKTLLTSLIVPDSWSSTGSSLTTTVE